MCLCVYGILRTGSFCVNCMCMCVWYFKNWFFLCELYVYVCMVLKGLVLVVYIVCLCVYGIERTGSGCVYCVCMCVWYLKDWFWLCILCVYVCMVFKGLVLVVCIVCVCVYGI